MVGCGQSVYARASVATLPIMLVLVTFEFLPVLDIDASRN